MNIKINLEVRRREKNIEIKIFSDNNPILIGKNGKNLESLQNIIRQIIYNQVEDNLKILLDVENYKDKKITTLERLAKRTAREVAKTKIETKLERMNSYERRIIHSTLNESKDVMTESEGEGSERHVVIKLKKVEQ